MSQPKICLVLNGPPNVGKDTLAEELEREMDFQKMSFKTALYEETIRHFGVDRQEFMDRATHRNYKEKHWWALTLPAEDDLLQVLSPREALIHVSEQVIKPLHGKAFFGKAVARDILRSESEFIVMADGGFPEEIAPLKAVCENVVVVRLHRKGCSFEGDSRDYLFPEQDSYDVYLEDDCIQAGVDDLLGITDKYIPTTIF